MLILLCDDDRKDLKQLDCLVSAYASEHPEYDLHIIPFSNPLDLMSAIDRHGAPDILLLDIFMPGILGTEIAQELLAQKAARTDIIFLTSSPDFAVEAFSLHVSDYIQKPYSESRLLDTLNRVIQKRLTRQYTLVQSGTETYRIDFYTVLYAEASGGGVRLHLCSGPCLSLRTSLSHLAETARLLRGFAPVGVSFLVNFRFVRCIRPDSLELTTGELIPVPRRLRSDLKQAYIEFYKEEALLP